MHKVCWMGVDVFVMIVVSAIISPRPSPRCELLQVIYPTPKPNQYKKKPMRA